MNPSSESGASIAQGLSLNPTELWLAIRRKKLWILLASLTVGAAVVAGTMQQPKVYRARAQILIEPVLPKVLGEGMGMDELSDNVRQERVFYNTQHKVITSRQVLQDVALRLGLAEDRAYLDAVELGSNPTEREIERSLLLAISVAPEPGSRIVNLVVEDRDPDRAAKIANALGQAYIDYSLERRLESTRGASKWLDERVTEFGRELELAEQALYDFKKRNMLVSVDIEDRQNMTSESMSILNRNLLETRTRLIELRARLKVVKELRAADPDAIEEVPGARDNAILTELRTSLVALEKTKADLSSRYGPKHPAMVGIDNQIAKTQGSVMQEVQSMASELENEVKALEQAEVELSTAMEKEKQEALALNSLGLEYAKLARDLGTTKEMYGSLLKRQTEADLSGLLKSNFVRWFEPAEPMRVPVRPSVPKNAALGLALGLLLGLLGAVAEVLLDNTVHTRADVEQFLRLPFLGIFPKLEKSEAKRAKAKGRTPNPDRDFYVLKNPKSGAAECARSLRTNVMFMGTGRNLKRILVTSAHAGEGKTTTAVALGITMAQAGAKVVVVDTDLRKPRLHRAFGVSGQQGVTSVMMGGDLSDALVPIDQVKGLDLLPCGPMPPNPSELLHSEPFADLLDQLSERYDRVLLDSPPIGIVTDAAILSKVADGTILVVQANGTPKEVVRRAARRLTDVGAAMLGVVLNDYDLGEGSRGGYEVYYDYSSYQYSSDEEEAAA